MLDRGRGAGWSAATRIEPAADAERSSAAFAGGLCSSDFWRWLSDTVHDQAAAEGFAGRGVSSAIEQRWNVHRVAGEIFGDDGIDSAFAGDSGANFGGEVYCPIPGVQTRTIRGVFFDWHAFEYHGGDRGRSDAAESILREFGAAAVAASSKRAAGRSSSSSASASGMESLRRSNCGWDDGFD